MMILVKKDSGSGDNISILCLIILLDLDVNILAKSLAKKNGVLHGKACRAGISRTIQETSFLSTTRQIAHGKYPASAGHWSI